MGPADALFHKDHINTTEDNTHTPIIPDPIVINALNLILSHHIQNSSASDPSIPKALAALAEGSPLFTHATLSDWSFDNGHLYFHNHMYVPPLPILLSFIPSTLPPSQVTWAFSTPSLSLSAISVMVEEAPTSFSPFSLLDCMLLSHFFLDLTRDLDAQI